MKFINRIKKVAKGLEAFFKKHLKIEIILFFIILLSLFYLHESYKIESTGLYPWNYNNEISYSISQGYDSNKCFHIYPIPVYYYVNKNYIETFLDIEKRCNSSYEKIHLSIEGMIGYSDVSTNREKGFIRNISWDANNPDFLSIIANSSDYIKLRIYLNETNKPYNIFSLSANDINIDLVQLIFDEDISTAKFWQIGNFLFRKEYYSYSCKKGCMSIVEGNYKHEKWSNNAETFEFDGESYIIFHIIPLNKTLFFIQKTLDGIVLGMIAGLIVELFMLLFDTQKESDRKY